MESRQFSSLERFLNPFISLALGPVLRITKFLNANCAAAAVAVAIGVRAPTQQAAARAFHLAREIALSHNCRSARAHSAVGLAFLLLESGDYDAARRLLEPELPTIRVLGDSTLLVEALLKLGAVMYEENWDSSALNAWTEAADVAHNAGYEFGYAAAISNLGGVAYRQHRDPDAKMHWQRALEIARRRHDKLQVAKLNLYLAIVESRGGNPQSARIRLNESAELYGRAGRDELAARARAIANELTDAAE